MNSKNHLLLYFIHEHRPMLPPPVPHKIKHHNDGKESNTNGLGTKHRVGDCELPLTTKKRLEMPK